ncbi:putative Cytochrome P450 monooxygenase aba1 [Seiridium cardinale]
MRAPVITQASALALIGVVLFTWLARRLIKRNRALGDFKGHWSSGWSRLWLLNTQGSGEMNKRFTQLNKDYGSTARIGPKMLITIDPDLLRRMNAVRSDFTRGIWYGALKLHPEVDNITSYVDEDKHADLRKRMTSGYSGKENQHMEDDIDNKLLDMFKLIDEKYLTSPERNEFRTVDLSRITAFFTLDTISQIAFGQAFGFLGMDDDPFGYLENLAQFLPAIIVFGVYIELTKLMSIPAIKAALPKSTDKRGLGRVMGFASDRVRERFGDKPIERKDMLGSFINHGLTQKQLESETLTQITAGSDSTASALRVTLHFISTTPRVLSRLLDEIAREINAGRISRPVVRDSEARQLPYLQACIKEGLRVYPPVTGLLAKQVPPGGTKIMVDGRECFAPSGTQIAQNSWGLMRRAEIFGDDCEIFRPERWLPANTSTAEVYRTTLMTETVGLAFGYGRFGCLGRGVAMMELQKGVFETLWKYNLQPCSLSKPFNEQCVGFTIHTDMYFIITNRGKEAEWRGNQHGGQNISAGALPGAQIE